jgi:hypothetical protein
MLFAQIYGAQALAMDYYWELMKYGALKQTMRCFNKEVKVWNEVSTLLHDEVSGKSFTRQSIEDFILMNRWRLAGARKVLKWVASEDELNTCLHTSK